LYFSIFSLDFNGLFHKFAYRVGKSGEYGRVFYPENKGFSRERSLIMSSFKGRYSYSVDSKGRVALPAKLRKTVSPAANDTFIITRGFEQCLFLYPQDEWNRLEESVRGLSPSNPQHRFFVRTLLQWATDAQLDSQARITVPQDLLKFGGIENEVLILGVMERIEIWNPKTFEEYMNNQPATYETVAEMVLKPGS
jgi:MraZ protein